MKEFGWTALHEAAALGGELPSGDVGAAAADGVTPLLVACGAGNLQAVRELLGRGADPLVAGEDEFTPCSRAAWEGRADILELLLQAGARVTWKDTTWFLIRRLGATLSRRGGYDTWRENFLGEEQPLEPDIFNCHEAVFPEDTPAPMRAHFRQTDYGLEGEVVTFSVGPATPPDEFAYHIKLRGPRRFAETAARQLRGEPLSKEDRASVKWWLGQL